MAEGNFLRKVRSERRTCEAVELFVGGLEKVRALNLYISLHHYSLLLFSFPDNTQIGG